MRQGLVLERAIHNRQRQIGLRRIKAKPQNHGTLFSFFFFDTFIFFFFELILDMEISGVLSRRNMPDEIGGFDLSPGHSEEEAHVLAVDDSLVDRKVIERLLKISSCKGLYIDFFLNFFYIFVTLFRL